MRTLFLEPPPEVRPVLIFVRAGDRHAPAARSGLLGVDGSELASLLRWS